jgi:hypothetical protein
VDIYSLTVTTDTKVGCYDLSFVANESDGPDWTELERRDAYLVDPTKYAARAQVPVLLWVDKCPVAIPFKANKTQPRQARLMRKCLVEVHGNETDSKVSVSQTDCFRIAISSNRDFTVMTTGHARGSCFWFHEDSSIRIASLGPATISGDLPTIYPLGVRANIA